MASIAPESAHRRSTAERVVQVLLAVAAAPGELGAAALARQLRLPRATVYRLLRTLEDQDLIRPGSAPETYSLGALLIALGESAREQVELTRVARPVLERLAEETAETVNLAVPFGDQVLVSVRVAGIRRRMVTVNLGPTVPLYSSAAGKVLLAYLPLPDLDRYLARTSLMPLTPQTLTDRRVLIGSLQAVRAAEVAWDHGETEAGLVSVAAPIRDRSGAVVAAVCVSGPDGRFPGDAARTMELRVGAAATEIAAGLGHPG